MRTLCLKFNTKLGVPCAEAFLTLSPRVQFRDPDFIYVDLESTLGLLGGESGALAKALQISNKLGATAATAVIADQPYSAQMLLSLISSSGAGAQSNEPDHQRFRDLPLSALVGLEGLTPWPQPRKIEMIAQFFHSIGIKRCGELMSFPQSSFRERWGAVGVTLWKRLHGVEEQPLSAWIPVDPLIGYGHLETSLGEVRLLMNVLHQALTPLFLRLHGLQKFARKMEVQLHCEFSNKVHSLSIEPVSPNRDLELFVDLLEARLAKVDLENPIKEFEITLFEQAEKVQQLDFFIPRDSSEDRWRRLISMAHQSGIEIGFLQPEPSHFPERSYTLMSDWPENHSIQDYIEKMDESVQVRFAYAKNLAKSPRPSLLLREPQNLARAHVQGLKMLTRFPAERIESSWWEYFRQKPSEDHRSRDYYFAVSPEGQLLWIFQDRESKEYFLHGYFD